MNRWINWLGYAMDYDGLRLDAVHAILDDMNEDALNRNEKFVQAFAARLAQVMRSARF